MFDRYKIDNGSLLVKMTIPSVYISNLTFRFMQCCLKREANYYNVTTRSFILSKKKLPLCKGDVSIPAELNVYIKLSKPPV